MLDISEVLSKIFKEMKIDARVESVKPAEEEDNLFFVNIEGNDKGLIIGDQGQTLSALQLIINIIFNKNSEEKKQIILDVDEYRQKRKRGLEDLAIKLAKKAIENNETIVLKPMSAFERKVVHLILQNNKEVDTISSGEEPLRKVSIIPIAE